MFASNRLIQVFYFLMIFLFLIPVSLANSGKISYSGRLVQANGAPLGGPVTLTFKIYVSPNTAADQEVCAETINDVALSNGVFNVELGFPAKCNGATRTFNELLRDESANGKTVYLEVTDNAGPKTYPMQAFNSIPYALYAVSAGVTTDNIADGSVTTDKIANASITQTKMKGILANCNTGEVLKTNADGSFSCAVDNNAGGDITSVVAGAGLVGGATQDDADLALDINTTILTKYVYNSGDSMTGDLFMDSAKIGINVAPTVNDLSVKGKVAIGATYATNSAPDSGLLVEGKVGIGSTSPVNQLDVTGSAAVSGSLGIGNTAPASELDVTGNAAVSGNVGIGTTAPAVNALDVKDGAVVIGDGFVGSDAPVDADLLVEKRVGFGTSNPQNALDVEGSVVIGPDYSGTEQTVGTGDLLVQGNVGIGSTVPANKLDVVGDASLTGELSVGLASSASKVHIKESTTNTGATAGLTIEQASTGDAILQFLIAGPTRWAMGIDNSDADKFKIGRGTDWAGGVDITVDTTGNVGIGTTDPLGKKLYIDGDLTVTGNTDFAGTVTITGAQSFANNLDMQTNIISNIGHANTDFTVGGGLNLAGNLAMQTKQITGIGTSNVEFGATGSLDMKNQVATNIGNANTDFTATGGLNLGDNLAMQTNHITGIGTNNVGFGATGALDMKNQVAENIGNANTDFTSAGGLNLADDLNVATNATVTGNLTVPTVYGGTAVLDNLVLESNSSVTKGDVLINPVAGYVGIGTTAPATELNVIPGTTIAGANIANAGLLIGTTTSGLGLDKNEIYTKGEHLTVGVLDSANDIFFRQGATELAMIDGATGNVGIGTTAPENDLHIKDTASSATLRLEATQDDQTSIHFESGAGGVQKAVMGYYPAHDAFKISHKEAGTTVADDHLVIKEGNVGIGTNNPGAYKLYVNGDAYIAGVTVTNGNLGFGGDLNMQNNLITNIGAAGTYFSAGGGLTLASDLTVNNITSVGLITGDFGNIAKSTDEWLRLNDGSTHTSGVYVPNLMRADGGFNVDGQTVIDASGVYYYSHNAGADKFGKVNASGWGVDANNTGDWDLLIYETAAYLPELRLGYGGNAILTTYDVDENLTIDPQGAGSTTINGTTRVNGTLLVGTESASIVADTEGLQLKGDGGVTSGWFRDGEVYIGDGDDALHFRGSIDQVDSLSFEVAAGRHDPIYRVGGVYFTWDAASYGTNHYHSIRSTQGDTWGDDITINSYGNVRVNIDSNSNGTDTFSIGHATTGTGSTLFTIDEAGNMTTAGRINTKSPTAYAAVTSLNNGVISVPDLAVAAGSYVPAVHQRTTVSGSGYRQHLVTGAYRGSTNWSDGGYFIAMGGNDANPTEDFKFLYGGTISHSSGNLNLSGNVSTGALTVPTLNTGHGANELYPMNQAVRTTDNVTFAQVYATDWVRPKGSSGLFFQDKGTGVRSPIDEGGTYGSVATYGNEGGWEGFSIGGSFVLMGRPDATYDVGLYNDIDNEWMIYGTRNAGIDLRYNGVAKLVTTSTGVGVTGTVTATTFSGDLSCTNCIDDNDVADNSLTAGSLADNSVGNAEINNAGSFSLTGLTVTSGTINNPSSSYKWVGGSDWNIFHTPSGYIQLGPANTTWAHIYTDRPNFYFNKPLYRENNKVWDAANDGAGSGLDADLLDGISSAGFIRDGVAGNWEVASNVKDDLYTAASLEIREYNMAGAQTGALTEAPHLSFHWGGRVASQIFLETDADISIRNNGGTGYEGLRVGELKVGATTVINSSRNIVNAGTGTFSGTVTAPTFSGAVSGNATTATALAANGANCSAGNAPLGVNASGAAESCFDVATQAELNTHTSATSVHGATSANTASRIVMRDASGNFAGGTVTVNGTLNVTDGEAQNVRALQLKDWDDDTGGTDNKYRLLARDGAFMFHDGGVVIGQYANGTWSDRPNGTLYVQGSTTTNGLYANRKGVIGTYDSTQVQNIWSMGSSYQPNTSGTGDFSNQYGMSYCHTNNANCKAGYGHQIDIQNNGVTGIALGFGGNAWFKSTVTAPTFSGALSGNATTASSANNLSCTACVQEGEIQQNTLDDSEIQDNSLTASSLAADSVGASEIAADAVGASEIAANAVGTSEVADNTLTATDLAPNSVGNSELIDNPTVASLLSNNYYTTSGNGRGLRFWNSDSYKIWMSSVSDGTWGGRLDSTSDYNMYFKMTGGTNRGFVFKNSGNEVAQIEGNGNIRATGTVYASSISLDSTTWSRTGTMLPYDAGADLCSCDTDILYRECKASDMPAPGGGPTVCYDRVDMRPMDGGDTRMDQYTYGAPGGLALGNSGNVGIGTNAPQSPLHVASNGRNYLVNHIIGTTNQNIPHYYVLLHRRSGGADIAPHQITGTISASSIPEDGPPRMFSTRINTWSGKWGDLHQYEGIGIKAISNSNGILYTLDYGGLSYYAIMFEYGNAYGPISFTGYADAPTGEMLKLVHSDDVSNIQPAGSSEPMKISGGLYVGAGIDAKGGLKTETTGNYLTGLSMRTATGNTNIALKFEDMTFYYGGFRGENIRLKKSDGSFNLYQADGDSSYYTKIRRTDGATGNTHIDDFGGGSIYLGWYGSSGNMVRVGNGDSTNYGTIQAANHQTISSKRYKKDIETISDGLEKVLNLRGVNYKNKHDDKDEMGLIAEEVEKIIPEIIGYDEEGRVDSIKYSRLVGVLVEATKEQQNIIKDNKEEISSLKKENQEIKAMFCEKFPDASFCID